MFFQKSCGGVKWRLWSVSVCLMVCGRINRPRSPTKQNHGSTPNTTGTLSTGALRGGEWLRRHSPCGRSPTFWLSSAQECGCKSAALSMSFAKIKKLSTKVYVNSFIILSALVDRLPR